MATHFDSIAIFCYSLLIDLMLKSTLLLLCSTAGVWLLRSAAAAARQFVWQLAIVALLALPLLTFTMPHWNISLFDRGAAPAQRESEFSRSQTTLPLPTKSLQKLSAPVERLPEVLGTSPLRVVAAPSTEGQKATGVPITEQETGVTHSHASRQESKLAHDFGVWCALAIWLAGVSVTLASTLAGLAGTRRLRRRSLPVEAAALRTLAEATQRELGIRRPVTLLHVTPEGPPLAPMTWGVFRPTILLPVVSEKWPPEILRSVLLHEMAHIRRHDWLFQMLAQSVRALYWFHPLVWWAVRRLDREAETACDDRVLLAGVVPSVYASSLLEVVGTMKKGRSPHTFAVGLGRPPLEVRLRAILAPHSCRRASRSMALLYGSIALLSVLPLASLRVVSAEQAPAQAVPPALLPPAPVNAQKIPGPPSLPKPTNNAVYLSYNDYVSPQSTAAVTQRERLAAAQMEAIRQHVARLKAQLADLDRERLAVEAKRAALTPRNKQEAEEQALQSLATMLHSRIAQLHQQIDIENLNFVVAYSAAKPYQHPSAFLNYGDGTHKGSLPLPGADRQVEQLRGQLTTTQRENARLRAELERMKANHTAVPSDLKPMHTASQKAEMESKALTIQTLIELQTIELSQINAELALKQSQCNEGLISKADVDEVKTRAAIKRTQLEGDRKVLEALQSQNAQLAQQMDYIKARAVQLASSRAILIGLQWSQKAQKEVDQATAEFADVQAHATPANPRYKEAEARLNRAKDYLRRVQKLYYRRVKSSKLSVMSVANSLR